MKAHVFFCEIGIVTSTRPLPTHTLQYNEINCNLLQERLIPKQKGRMPVLTSSFKTTSDKPTQVRRNVKEVFYLETVKMTH